MKVLISILTVLLLQACSGDTSMPTQPGPKPSPKPDPHIETFYFTGAWAGPGIVKIDKNNQMKCEDISLEFDQQKENLVLKALGWTCGDVARKINSAISYDVKEGVLFYQNKKYGVISEQRIDLIIPGKNSSSKYLLTYNKNKKAISYNEVITHSNSRVTWTVIATLNKK